MIQRPRSRMTRRALLAALATSPLAAAHAEVRALPAVSVWKDRDCACCGGWVAHMRAAGFSTVVNETDDMAAIKQRFGIPGALQSCHTAIVDRYVLEGHVPAEDVRRLLVERPEAAGLSVPGMPASAPGMDIPGQPYHVVLFGPAIGHRTFAQH